MRKPEQVQKDLSALKKKGIEIVNDEVVSIDVGKRSVKTTRSEFSYGYLVISLGAEYSSGTIPGFSDYVHHIYDLDSATRFRDVVEKFAGGTLAIGISRTPFKCPAAPYEVALLLEDYYTKKGMRDKVKFEFFTPEANPVPAAGAEIGNKVSELLKSRG
ncbi:MAG: FAD/NAD(P)-binding oxidoreductase [Conexivisphaerales archaeon]